MSTTPMDGTRGRASKPAFYSSSHWGILVLLLAGLTGVAVVLWSRNPTEPVYQGRTLGQWLMDLDYSHRPLDLAALNTVQKMGTNILPHLRPMLRARDSGLKLRFISLLSKQPFFRIDFVRAEIQQERASRACRALGPAAARYLPELTAMLDSTNHTTAWCGYVAILDVKSRNDCVLELTKALTNNYAQVRWHAAELLGTLKAQGSPAVPALMKALKDPDPRVRKNSLMALQQIGVEVPVMVQLALPRLDDPDTQVRLETIQMLSQMGWEAQPAKERLLRSSKDPDIEIRKAALNVFRVMGLEPATLTQALAAFMDDPEPDIRLNLTYELGRLSRQHDSAKHLLQRYLQDKDPRVRTVAEGYFKQQ